MEKRNDNNKENYFAEEKAKTILAVDLGTTTGWAIRNEFGITSGSMSFKPTRFEVGDMRYLQFQKWLEKLTKLDIVYFKEVRRDFEVDASNSYGGFLRTLITWCEMKKIPYQSLSVGATKQFIARKGNATKLEVINAVEMLGYRPTDDNEAKALAILYLAMHRESSAKKIIGGEL